MDSHIMCSNKRAHSIVCMSIASFLNSTYHPSTFAFLVLSISGLWECTEGYFAYSKKLRTQVFRNAKQLHVWQYFVRCKLQCKMYCDWWATSSTPRDYHQVCILGRVSQSRYLSTDYKKSLNLVYVIIHVK